MALSTTSGRRISAVAGTALLTATALGVALWLSRRLDQSFGSPVRDELAPQVESLVAAHDRLAEAIDRRLRSLEESAARSEAEVRFMSTLLGEQESGQSTQKTPSTGADLAERRRWAPARRLLQPAGEGVEGVAKGVTT